ncbi:DEAD/DEAH box helicase [Candidatus Saccharibacteria bacterium]|nr:DEAD/DEAH box helicase [Candidatus Saccharibacteria bacterium]
MRNNYRPGGDRRSRQAPHKRRNNSSKSATIPVNKFINHAVEPEREIIYTPIHTFHEFGLNQKTVSTLDYLGLTSPSAIQDQSIPYALEGRDIIGLANTGTGKTAAFLLPIINQLSIEPKLASVLILAPTRELAQQIDNEFRRFSAGQRLFSTLVVGGANIGRQIQQIKRGPHIVIGTPGRVKDLINRNVLRLQNTTTFVLDEADRMCDMGFVGDIKSIASELPVGRQTLCYSATMTAKVKEIVEEFMNDPVTLSVVKGQTHDHIEQDVIYVSDKVDKVEKLVGLLQQPEFEKVIIFGETKYGVQRLADHLAKSDLPAVALHGNKSQSQRNRALKEFKDNNATNILVATDVAARGIDIDDVSHVINFDIPRQYDDYIHRIGRTGRAGKTGKALTFVPK